MDSDQRRDNAYRQHNACRKCGGMYTTDEKDGSQCDGLPAVTYKVCRQCGHVTAKAKRLRKAMM